MNLLCDEGVDRLIVEWLRRDGHEVAYVAEMEPGIDDEEVLRRANESSALLVTLDKDFGELVFRLRRASPGVLLVRLPKSTSAERAEIVAAVVRTHRANLEHAFTVVSPRRVRIRRGG
ncbi:MAG: DUF5615 family PIN-like protein [Longimicrobiaceae bacterium]